MGGKVYFVPSLADGVFEGLYFCYILLVTYHLCSGILEESFNFKKNERKNKGNGVEVE